MGLNRNTRSAAAAVCLLFVTGCSPLQYMNYLQFFSALLSPGSTTLHVERGKRDTHTEYGLSVAAGTHEERAEFNHGATYDTATGFVDSSATNCFMRFPLYNINAYAAVLGENWLSGIVEASWSEIDGQSLYSAAVGIGARAYAGELAGRLFLLAGVTNMHAVVDIYQDEVATNYHYHLRDSFNAQRYFAGFALGMNMINDHYHVNPFINLSGRCFNLFNYYPVSIDLVTFSGTAGFYRQTGPLRLSVGVRGNFHEGDREERMFPQLITQITYTPGG